MHARSSRIPIKPATFWRSLAADPSDGSAAPASTIASVDARETHRQRGDGRSPSGSRSNRCVPIKPRGRTQIRFENHCGCDTSPTGRISTLQNRPITSMNHPAGFSGRRSATSKPTIENASPAGTNESEPTADATVSVSSASLIPVSTRPPTTASAASANSIHASPRSLDACCVRSFTGGPFDEDGSPYRASCAVSRESPRRWERVEPPPWSAWKASLNVRSPVAPNRQEPASDFSVSRVAGEDLCQAVFLPTCLQVEQDHERGRLSQDDDAPKGPRHRRRSG